MKSKDIAKHLEDGVTEFAFSQHYTPRGTRLGDNRLSKVTLLSGAMTEHEQRNYWHEQKEKDPEVRWRAPTPGGHLARWEDDFGAEHTDFIASRDIFGPWEEHERIRTEREEREQAQRNRDAERRQTAADLCERTGIDPERYSRYGPVLVEVGALVEDKPDITEVQPHVYSMSRTTYVHLLDEDLVRAVNERAIDSRYIRANCIYIHLHVKGVL